VNPVTNPEEDDFLKRLLGDSAAKVEPVKPIPPAKAASSPPPASVPNNPHNPLSEINIEELLRLTAPTPIEQPQPAAVASVPLQPPPPPSFAHPMFTPPPPPTGNSFAPPPPPPSASESRPPDPPKVKKAGYKFDRGFFYKTDEVTNVTTLLGPAKFGTRLFGAIIDAVLAGLLVFACSGLIENILKSMFAADAVRLVEQAQTARTRAEGLRLLGQAQELLTSVVMMSDILETGIALLYYTLLVGLFGKTIGHLVMGITIMQKDGKKAGFASAFIRAVYGSIGSFAAIFAYPQLFQSIFGSAVFGNSRDMNLVITICIGLIILQGVVAFGLWWMVKDDFKQGWHDKLAGTYAIKNKPIPLEETAA
jgi:uncharacterized RDD family membrane protein YckC